MLEQAEDSCRGTLAGVGPPASPAAAGGQRVNGSKTAQFLGWRAMDKLSHV